MTAVMKETDEKIFIYKNKDGEVKVKALFTNNDVWLTYKQISQLFAKDEYTINKHVLNILESKELDEKAVTSKFEVTASDGKKYNTLHFNLDMIIHVGYRVNSEPAIAFRKWATERLKDYLQHGNAIDVDEVLRNPAKLNSLINRVKALRAGEQLVWKQLLAIYAKSPDFQNDTTETRIFIANVQNLLHYAVHGHTASELIYERADHTKPLLGMLSFNGEVPTKFDIYTAKNYLSEEELSKLDKLVRRILDFTTDKAEASPDTTMTEWMQHINAILNLSGKNVSFAFSKIKRREAINKASIEFFKYKATHKTKYQKVGKVYRLDISNILKELYEQLASKKDTILYSLEGQEQKEDLLLEVIRLVVDSYSNSFITFNAKLAVNVQNHEYFHQFDNWINPLSFQFISLVTMISGIIHMSISKDLPVLKYDYTLTMTLMEEDFIDVTIEKE